MQKLFYRVKDLATMMGVSKYTIYNWVAAGKFPKGVKLGKRTVGYPVPQIHQWLEEHGISFDSLSEPDERT